MLVTKPLPPQYRQVFVSVGLAAIALAIGFGVTHGLTQLKRPPELRVAEEREYKVEVFKVESQSVREIVRAFGTSQAEREVVLSAQVAGEVVELHPLMKVGSQVQSMHLDDTSHPGDLLVRIDPKLYEARIAQGTAQLEEDRAELRRIQQDETNLDRLHATIAADFDDSQREFEKSQLLRKQGVNTDSDLRRAQMELRQHEKLMVQSRNDKDLLPIRREQVQRRIESHEAALKLAEIDLQRTIIRPPFDGIVSAVQVEVGQYVRAGEPVATITDESLVEVPLSVTLEDYSKLLLNVKNGQFPAVELAENENAPPRWKGNIIRMSPKADEHTRTAMVFVQVDNAKAASPLLPGTFVQARIDGPILTKARIVPRDAVLDRKAFVEKDGVIEERTVTVARTLHNFVVIDSGLETGDRLVLTNLDVLYDGARVATSATRTLAEELGKQRSQSARLLEENTTAESGARK